MTAQLVDALIGRHVWSERYDRILEDIFVVQDEIWMEIMRAMDTSLVGLGRLKEMHTPSICRSLLQDFKGY